VDAVIWRDVNECKPPYVLYIDKIDIATESVREFALDLRASIDRARREHVIRTGQDVEVTIVLSTAEKGKN
jgi:hypothetical protein